MISTAIWLPLTGRGAAQPRTDENRAVLAYPYVRRLEKRTSFFGRELERRGNCPSFCFRLADIGPRAYYDCARDAARKDGAAGQTFLVTAPPGSGSVMSRVVSSFGNRLLVVDGETGRPEKVLSRAEKSPWRDWVSLEPLHIPL